MNSIENITAILHIIDSKMPAPILSDTFISLDDLESKKYLEKLIEKAFMSPERKSASFSNDSLLYSLFCDYEKTSLTFLELSQQIAINLHKIISVNDSIPSGDLLISTFKRNNSNFISVIKCNYKEGFTHYVTNEDGKTKNSLIKYKTIISTGNQKIEEAVIFDFSTKNLIVIEKLYEIQSKLTNYFSEIFLACNSNISIKKAIDIVYDTAKEIAKTNDNDITIVPKLKNTLMDYAELGGTFQVSDVAERLFPESEQLQEEYTHKVSKHVINNEIEIDRAFITRKSKASKIVTDTGIEITIPTDSFSNKDIVEFINNPDGTISIYLKNIGQILNK